MTTVPMTYSLPVSESWPTLRRLADRLMHSFHAIAGRNKSYFVNDIPDQLYIDTNSEIIASILSGLLAAVVNNAKESCIRISAKIYGNVILVHVKDYNSINYYPVENGLQELQSLAEQVGGCVSVTSQRHNIATFAFSFPNLPLAA
jgi:hypothetical protein